MRGVRAAAELVRARSARELSRPPRSVPHLRRRDRMDDVYVGARRDYRRRRHYLDGPANYRPRWRLRTRLSNTMVGPNMNAIAAFLNAPTDPT